MNHRHQPTAAETYELRHQEIRAMLDFLSCELEAHAERANAKGLTWGHVGDLDHLRRQMKEMLVSTMGARDEAAAGEQIETALADALSGTASR